MKRSIVLLVLAVQIDFAQPITWADSTSTYRLPPGVTLFKGVRTSPALTAACLVVDLTDPAIVVYPYLASVSEAVPAFTSRVGAIAAVNGGFFGGSTSYSAIAQAGQLLVSNVQVLNRTSGTYYATRSLFSYTAARSMSIDWIYHFDATINGIYRFAQPNPNTATTPAPAPLQSQGTQADSSFAAIGGGPRLVKNGQVHVTYDEEVFFGSGVNGTSQEPRTAVGFTSDRRVVLVTVDGRQTSSVGATLNEMAQFMIERGCVEAMNLDGGGSAQMAIPGRYVNVPSEVRAVPTILAVVHADSVPLPKTVYYEKTIDADDPTHATFAGTGWFTSANTVFWGGTPAWLNAIGNGLNAVRFQLNLPAAGVYEISAWWVAASNRATNTPFIVTHTGGADTLRENQVNNGSMWKVLGSYAFRGDTADAVTITNGATNGSYVVADGIRVRSYSPIATYVEIDRTHLPQTVALSNYPNPFNPETMISFAIPNRIGDVAVVLRIYDVLGREMATLTNEAKHAGVHTVQWDASNVPSGVYLCRLAVGDDVLTRKLVLVR